MKYLILLLTLYFTGCTTNKHITKKVEHNKFNKGNGHKKSMIYGN